MRQNVIERLLARFFIFILIYYQRFKRMYHRRTDIRCDKSTARDQAHI